MRRLNAAGAIAALVLATIYAPLFHLHAEGGGAPLIHAHFPELEAAEDESVVHMERAHSHALARSVDVLITTTASRIHLDGILVSAEVVATPDQPCIGFVPVAVPQSHDPPEISSRIPRAPPA